MGYAHSVECWSEGALAGGLYGVAIGGAFFGESMFSREKDASQVCLVYLVERLRAGGATLLDVQFSNPHLEQFGLLEISRADYLEQLSDALQRPDCWNAAESGPGEVIELLRAPSSQARPDRP